MKVINGENCSLGRVGSLAVKSALKGDDIAIVNCDKILITGNKKRNKEDFEIKRGRIGHSQKGPKHSSDIEKFVKRSLRGMLPNHRFGRGRIAFKKIKCYKQFPSEFKDMEVLKIDTINTIKYSKAKDIIKR